MAPSPPPLPCPASRRRRGARRCGAARSTAAPPSNALGGQRARLVRLGRSNAAAAAWRWRRKLSLRGVICRGLDFARLGGRVGPALLAPAAGRAGVGAAAAERVPQRAAKERSKQKGVAGVDAAIVRTHSP
eukprot:353857-Chlamydomonas_euryale.AAC.9